MVKKKGAKSAAGAKSKGGKTGDKKGGTKNKNSLGSYGHLAKQAKTRKGMASGPSPATSLKQGLGSMSVLKDLHDGIPVTKISHNGDFHRRLLTLSKDRCTLFVTHRKVADAIHVSRLPKPVWTRSKGWNGSYQRYIDVADFLDIQVGVVGTQDCEKALDKKKLDELTASLVTVHHREYLGQRSLSFLVENPSHRKALVAALTTMRRNYLNQEQWVGREILLLRYVWYDIDADMNSMISQKEFVKICERINLYIPEADKRFQDFLKTNGIKKKEITYGQCTKLLNSLKGKEAVDEVWKQLFGNVQSITAKTFHQKFIIAAQGEKKTELQDAKDLIASLNTVELEVGSEPKHSLKLEKTRFAEFLRSEWNDAFDPKSQEKPKKALTKPLSAYWINTSHNTYLMGDQLKSKSSVEAYTDALQRGCKCLELDCWNGSKNKDDYVPVVYHGHTLTSKIELRQVLLVVQNYLQTHPDYYPIILSIENHCSLPYQEVMAKMIKEIFGARLYIPTSAQRTMKMPTPEELKGMVIIKGKRPPDPDDGEEDEPKGTEVNKRNTETFFADMFEKFEPERKPASSRISSFVPKSFAIGRCQETGSGKGKEKHAMEPEDDDDDGEIPKYSKELLEFTYFHKTKFRFFEESIDLMPSHMHSIGETKIVKLVTQYDNNPDLWRQYNTGHMTRTYPAGTRVDSSNYNPVLAWAMGCQLVALNFQTSDLNLALNDGRFRQFGNCGYVEKPKSIMGFEKPKSKKITIRILSGSCLPKPKGEKTGEHIDPFVKLELHDVRVTKRGKEQFYTQAHVTKCADNNGYSPVWSDESKEFVAENPGVAMLVFRLIDEDIGVNDQIASAAIPVSCLRKGFRSIQLRDPRNSRLGPFHYATLLVHIVF
jgi:phosphatidylinositol phospholipase C delta